MIMDSAYVNSWLRQAQQFSSLQAGNRELAREMVPQLGADTPMLPATPNTPADPPQMSSDEPLDLRVKPVDTSLPLDLTLSKPASNGLPTGDTIDGGLSAASLQFSRPTSYPVNHMPFHHPPLALFSPYMTPTFTRQMPKYPPPISDSKLHCTYCAYQCDIQMRESFERHLTAHAPHSQHYCIYCKQIFADQTALRDHLPIHDYVYTHVCLCCNIAFKLSDAYTAHMAEIHNRSHDTKVEGNLMARMMAPENTLLKVGSVSHSPSDRSRSASTNLSTDLRSSPLSTTGGSNSCSSLLSAATISRTPSQQSTFGQSLAKQIEAAISHQVAGGKTPSLSEVMFMKCDSGTDSTDSNPAKKKNPLNLMSLLDKVVEESIRAGPNGATVEKADLNFTVTFSDDEEETEVKESTSAIIDIKCEGSAGTAEGATSDALHCKNTGNDNPTGHNPAPTNQTDSLALMKTKHE